MKKRILVTGASGFLALHCIDQLIKSGYRVRGTLRTLSRIDEVRAALGDPDKEALEFCYADLTEDDGWDEALQGIDGVLHVASPYPPTEPKHESDLIIPARDGALRVLQAARKAGVKRVVLTSSLLAMAGGRPKSTDHVITEADWTDLSDPFVSPYEKSKTLAELAAWDFVNKEGAPELVVINPGAILGPLLAADYSASGVLVRQLMNHAAPGCPPIGMACVDVRDVAKAQVAALEIPNAAGNRYLCALDNVWVKDIAAILAAKYNSAGWTVPTRELPAWLAKLLAKFKPTLKRVRHMIGHKKHTDNSKIKRDLGIVFRSMEEMTISMAESMIALGVLMPRAESAQGA